MSPDEGGRMQSINRRQSRAGRWVPVGLYAIIVLGWVAEAVSDGAAAGHLRLAAWTLPAPALYLWRTRKRR
jgi:hypothetical protein